MSEEKFIDVESGDNYGNGGEFSFKSILLTHLARITKICCQEFHGGYWSDKPALGGAMFVKVYIPSTRDEYINSVNCLTDLLLPYFDKDMLTVEDVLTKQEDLLRTEHTGTDDAKLNFKRELLPVKRTLFRELSKFLQRKNYLESGFFEDDG